MVGIILASHGAFAEGIKESAQMIFGNQDKFEAVVLKPSMGPDDFRANLEAAIEECNTQGKFLMYAKEQNEFERVVRKHVPDEMWERLERAFEYAEQKGWI